MDEAMFAVVIDSLPDLDGGESAGAAGARQILQAMFGKK